MITGTADAQGRLKSYSVTVTVSGSGRVTSDIPGIDCPDVSCTARYNAGTTVTLTGAPGSGARLMEWLGSCSVLAVLEECVIQNIASNLNVEAVFDRVGTVINFDDLERGTILGDQYADLGVTFRPAEEYAAGYVGQNGDYGTYEFGNSSPNFVIVGVGVMTIDFDRPVSNISMRVGDGDTAIEALGISAFGVGGQLLNSQIVHLYVDGATVAIPAEGVVEVRLFGIYGCSNCGSGFAIDDLMFR